MHCLLPLLSLVVYLQTDPTREVSEVVAANNQFALDCLAELRRSQSNLIFSPYCIGKTLSMAYAGARGETAREMAAALHFTLGQQRQSQAYGQMRKKLNREMILPQAEQRSNEQLYLSANLWGQRGYGFEKSYLRLLDDCYGSKLQEIDFHSAEKSRQIINGWVERQTNRRIQELFPSGTISPNSRLVLAGAIYFKGRWSTPFEQRSTRSEQFYVNARSRRATPMMNAMDEYGYLENESVQGLSLPYEGEKRAMLVLLPRKVEGLAELEKSLTAEKLQSWIAGLLPRKVQVTLPKFRMTQAFALEPVLSVLGIRKAFRGDEADFSGMNGGREPLFISAVVHKAFVEVNEEGTEAAAATGVSMATLSAPPLLPTSIPVFRADHPFVFLIYDVKTGLILFLGHVTEP